MATDLNKFKWIFVTDTGHRFKSFTWLHTEEKILTFNPPSGGGGGGRFQPRKEDSRKERKRKKEEKRKRKGPEKRKKGGKGRKNWLEVEEAY